MARRLQPLPPGASFGVDALLCALRAELRLLRIKHELHDPVLHVGEAARLVGRREPQVTELVRLCQGGFEDGDSFVRCGDWRLGQDVVAERAPVFVAGGPRALDLLRGDRVPGGELFHLEG